MTNTFSDNNQIEVVSSFSELVNSKFQGEMNALCWHRNLVGDFKEIVAKLELKENITEVSIEDCIFLHKPTTYSYSFPTTYSCFKSAT